MLSRILIFHDLCVEIHRDYDNQKLRALRKYYSVFVIPSDEKFEAVLYRLVKIWCR